MKRDSANIMGTLCMMGGDAVLCFYDKVDLNFIRPLLKKYELSQAVEADTIVAPIEVITSEKIWQVFRLMKIGNAFGMHWNGCMEWNALEMHWKCIALWQYIKMILWSKVVDGAMFIDFHMNMCK